MGQPCPSFSDSFRRGPAVQRRGCRSRAGGRSWAALRAIMQFSDHKVSNRRSTPPFVWPFASHFPFPFSLRRRTSPDGGRPRFLALKLTGEGGCSDPGRLPEPVLTKASLWSGREVKINLTVSIILCCIRCHTLSLDQPSNTDTMKAILSVVFSLVVGSVVYLFSRLYKVRKEMEQLVRDHRLHCPVRKRHAN
jgi:hypothetical protein